MTELARALDEELTARGLRAADLDATEYAFALLTIQALAEQIQARNVPAGAIAPKLLADPRLADVGEERLHRTDYREIRDQLVRAFGSGSGRVQQLDHFLTGSLAHRTDLLSAEDQDAVEDFLTARLARREARISWEKHLGALLSHSQVLAITGWSKQALSQAVREHRVLRLSGSGQERFYPAAVFDDATPARPLPGAKQVLGLWAPADPKGWTTASWLTTPQVELGHRTPRRVMLESGTAPEELLTLAGQAIDRLVA